MRKFTKHTLTSFLCIIFVFILMMGCTPAKRPLLPNSSQKNMTYHGPQRNWLDLSLEREIKDMEGIKDAVVIIDNGTAFVGIEEEDGRTPEVMRATQSQIASKIRSKIPEVERIYVTSEMDRVDQLRHYSQKMNNGKDVKDYKDELESLF